MPSPYEGFLWRENEESMFWSFHPLADETNNEHLPKPFFKVIRKSLYQWRIFYEKHTIIIIIIITITIIIVIIIIIIIIMIIIQDECFVQK